MFFRLASTNSFATSRAYFPFSRIWTLPGLLSCLKSQVKTPRGRYCDASEMNMFNGGGVVPNVVLLQSAWRVSSGAVNGGLENIGYAV